MDSFWRFARDMLYYKTLIVWAFAGALLDAACAFAGFASLSWIIQFFFSQDQTARDILTQKLTGSYIDGLVNVATITSYIPESRLSGLGFMLGMILILAIIGSCGRFLHQYCTFTVSLRSVMRLRKTAFQRLVHLPLLTVSEDGTSDKISRIVRDCNQLARGFNAMTGKAVRDVLQGSALLLLAVFLDWQLTAIFLLGAPIIAVLIRKFGKKIRRASKRALKEYGTMLAAINESLMSLRVVKVHQGEGYERRRFNNVNRKVLAEEMSVRTVRAVSSPVVELISLLGVMVVVLVAAWYMESSSQGPESLVSVLMALAVAGASFQAAAKLNNDLQEAAAAAGRIAEVVDLPVEREARGDNHESWIRLPRHKSQVRFNDVWFTYPEAESPSLRGVTLAVDQGQVCAIVGTNGSGKSTLLGLLPRLYSPDTGNVTIDGNDIADCTLKSLRAQIAMVTQDTVLFDGTIADNLRYGMRHIDSSLMIEAAEKAHADEFVDKLPNGYDTQIGEWGSRLSGGQRQRLAIARAILRNPAILILDEATSQIDADSESKITEALGEFMSHRTTFVIAHRLSTVVNADKIVVMDAGQIVAVGKHQELLNACNIYQVLCRTQLQGLQPTDQDIA